MTLDMTTGKPLNRILLFCIPVLVGSLFQQLYNLADSFLVGRILGVNAFAAVGSTGSLNFLILGFALGACSGLAIPIAQSFGAGDPAMLRRRAGQLVWLGVLLTLVLTLITGIWTDDILRLTRTPAEIYDEAYSYILILFLGSGATILFNLLSAVLRALGDSRTPLWFLTVTVVLNIFLDILLMQSLHMGVGGAALATVLSQLVSGLACLVYIGKKVPLLRLQRSDLRPDWRLMAQIAGLGLPMGLQFSITAIGAIMLQGAVNSLGTGAVAAVAAANKVHALVAAPLETTGVAMATWCGQNLGAGNLRRVRQGIQATVLMSIAYCVLALALNTFAGAPLAALFLEGNNQEILRDVRTYLITSGCAYPALAVIFIFRNALQGMGFSRQAMSAGLAELVARGAVAFGLVGALGYQAVCLAGPLAWVCADVILLILYRIEMRALEARFPAEGPVEAAAALRLRRADAK